MFRDRRRAAGISLREVSRQTGINPGRLSVIERGVEPSAIELRQIVEVLERAESQAMARNERTD
jgi:transcriptional regulator with XRE-family HTH domain